MSGSLTSPVFARYTLFSERAFMVFFLLIPITILIGLYGYVGHRVIMPSNLAAPWKGFAWTCLLILALMPLALLIMRANGIEGGLMNTMAWIGFSALGFVSVTFVFTCLRDMGRLVRFLWKKVNQWQNNPGHHPRNMGDQVSRERRDLLKHFANIGILSASGILSGYGFVQAHCRIQVKRISIAFDDLIQDLKTLRIVQISDIHVGFTVKRDFVRAIVEKVNGLNPDLIVLTGDLVDGAVEQLKGDVAPLSDLVSRYGNFFVTGNHEYFSDVDTWLEEIHRLGFLPLMNEHRVITHHKGRILLGGVTDYSGGRRGQRDPVHVSDPWASIKNAPESDIKILLAHQPLSIFQAAPAGYDLQLSGHTHGGQYFPWSALVALRQPYMAGLYKHDKTWIYVNEGTGYWGPPLRLGTRSEITLITLTDSKDNPITENPPAGGSE